jgi:hypothetical protein
MAISRDDVIALVAKEHGILISRDDPILSLLAVHQVILEHYEQRIGASFENTSQQFSQQLSDTQQEFVRNAKVLANEVVGDAIKRITVAEQRITQTIKQYQHDNNRDNARQTILVWMVITSVILGIGNLIINIIH